MSAKTGIRSFRIYTRDITKGGDDDVSNLALDVGDALLNHPFFIKLPVSLPDLAAQQSALSGAMTEARKGGTDRTRAKNAAKLVLTDSLFKIALYCMGEARHDLDMLLSSGFEVASTNRTPAPLDKPSIIDLLNNISGQLLVRGQGVLNGRVYLVEASTDGGVTWVSMGKFNGACRMLLQSVIPGTIYMVRFCALGGSTGQSPWSDVVSRMAT
jgi:hypothetical protein